MITCHLTKLESALDTVRKSYPKLKPADAGLIASALTLAGRHAVAVRDGNHYIWPDDYEALTQAMRTDLEVTNQSVDSMTKKAAKAAAEEEPLQITVGLAPNLSAGERLLQGREDLKTLLADIIQEGVEFAYVGNDIGWQWSLDRANWSTVSGTELSRRVRVKASFTEGAVGLEMGTTSPKKRASKAKPVAIEAEPEPEEVPQIDTD